MRRVSEKRLGMTERGWLVQPKRAAVYAYAPHLTLRPGLFLAIVVWDINMLSDALRDLLDPRLGVWDDIGERR